MRKHMRWLPFLFLLGCPVEPKDIQDLSQNNNPGPGKPQLIDGKPPGSPPKDQGEVVPLPPPNGEEQEAVGPENENPINPNRNDLNTEVEPTVDEQNPDQTKTENDPTQPIDNVENHNQGDINTPTGPHPGTPGSLPVQDGVVPENTDGNVLPPATAGDVLPLYQELPTFSEVTESGKTIDITLNVKGAAAFDFEFVVQREGEGRSFPKVIHKQSMATSPIEVEAPANYKEPVWLIITADLTGDGPTPDDLVAGTSTPLELGASDMELQYTLTSDEGFLKNLPWFSQATEGPTFNGGL
jgi:hypothetical protein